MTETQVTPISGGPSKLHALRSYMWCIAPSLFAEHCVAIHPSMLLLSRLLLLFVMPLTGFASERPSFVMIALDDLNHYTTPHLDQPDNFLRRVYSDPKHLAEIGRRLTPNLQRLASQSLSFSRAYCPSALCGPSRTALLGGIPPHLSGYYQHGEHFRHNPALKDVTTLPQYLKTNGWFTTGLGKVFHKQMVEVREGVRQDWPDIDHSWSRWIERRVGANADQGMAEHHARTDPVPAARRTLSPYSPNDGLFTFGVSRIPVEETFDFQNARFAADLIAKGRATIIDGRGQPTEVVLPPDQPFFLSLGLFLPHLPWVVPQEFLDRFPVAEMQVDSELVRWVTDDINDLPAGTARQWLGKDFDSLLATGENLHGPGGVTEAWKSALQHYLASIAFADHCLGQVIDALERSPHRDNTVVLLWGDHGWNLGDKRRFRKQALWEGANHTTLLWRDPAATAGHHGLVCNRLVSLQDIYPTLAARAGLPVPAHVHGRDLAPLLADPQAQWENVLLQTYNQGNHALRTATHRYISYADGGRELYDLRADPFEITNLATDHAHAAVVAAFHDQLTAFLARDSAFYRKTTP
jgi:arylsulfatase A-like enzyme